MYSFSLVAKKDTYLALVSQKLLLELLEEVSSYMYNLSIAHME